MRQPWKFAASVVALAALVACGGDGDGVIDDGANAGDDPAPTLPTGLSFSGALIDGVPMLISAAGQNVAVTGFGFSGTWDRSANRYTLPANQTSLNIDLGSAGALVAGVTGTASWVGVVPPAASGTVSAQSLAGPLVTPLFTGIASVTALSESSVRLSWDGTTPATTLDTTWEAFLNGDWPASWQTGIQAGFGVLAVSVEKLQFALDQFVYINANDAPLSSAGSTGVSTACAGGVGTRKVVWNDMNGDGALGPGDGFTVTFTGCRIDMPGDIDQLLNGQILISAYIENSSPFSVGGRVDFAGLQQTETDAEATSLSTTGSIQLFMSGN